MKMTRTVMEQQRTPLSASSCYFWNDVRKLSFLMRTVAVYFSYFSLDMHVSFFDTFKQKRLAVEEPKLVEKSRLLTIEKLQAVLCDW